MLIQNLQKTIDKFHFLRYHINEYITKGDYYNENC